MDVRLKNSYERTCQRNNYVRKVFNKVKQKEGN